MPVYENSQPPYAIYRGDEFTLVNAEELGAGVYSERVAIGPQDGFPAGPLSVTFHYATTPGSVEYDIYVANDDSIAPGLNGSDYIKIGSTTNTAGDRVDINTLTGGLRFRFLCVLEKTSPGVNATVKVLQ